MFISLGGILRHICFYRKSETSPKTDAGRMLESILEIELKGGTNEEARTYAKAGLKLALALQHKRNADYKTAALCAEATISVVNIVSILCKEVNL